MLSEEELIDLCGKYKTHELSEAEFQKLQAWVNSSEENFQFFSNYVKLYKAVCGVVFTGWLLQLVCLLLLF